MLLRRRRKQPDLRQPEHWDWWINFAQDHNITPRTAPPTNPSIRIRDTGITNVWGDRVWEALVEWDEATGKNYRVRYTEGSERRARLAADSIWACVQKNPPQRAEYTYTP